LSTYDTDTRHNKTAIQDRQDKGQTQAGENIHQQRNGTTTDKNRQGEPHNKQDTDRHTDTPITPTAKRADLQTLFIFVLTDFYTFGYINIPTRGRKSLKSKKKGQIIVLWYFANNSIYR
jgi:hypothetical protein